MQQKFHETNFTKIAPILQQRMLASTNNLVLGKQALWTMQLHRVTGPKYAVSSRSLSFI